MKQTLSMLYRLGFLLLALWAFFDRTVLLGYGFLNTFGVPAVFFCCLFFVCILAVFLVSLFGNPLTFLQKPKAVFTAMALFLLAVHFPVWFRVTAENWVFSVALPALFVLDWLLFDKKGTFRPLDPLFWLLGILALLALWLFLSKTPFRLSSLLTLLGGKDRLLPLIASTLLAGGLMYLLDRLLSGKKSKSLWDLFAFLYRLVFLALTAYGITKAANNDFLTFLKQLPRFVPLFHFLSFLCILLVVLICLFRYRKLHAQTPFPRIKGGFTATAVLFLAGNRFVFGAGSVEGTVSMILCYICPLMLIFDWILFDAKGKWQAKDILLWTAVPLCYGLLVFLAGKLLVFYPVLHRFSPEYLIAAGVLGTLACSCFVYLLDLCFKRR